MSYFIKWMVTVLLIIGSSWASALVDTPKVTIDDIVKCDSVVSSTGTVTTSAFSSIVNNYGNMEVVSCKSPPNTHASTGATFLVTPAKLTVEKSVPLGFTVTRKIASNGVPGLDYIVIRAANATTLSGEKITFHDTDTSSTSKKGTATYDVIGEQTFGMSQTDASFNSFTPIAVLTPSVSFNVTCKTCLNNNPSTKATFSISVNNTSVEKGKPLTYSVKRTIGSMGNPGHDIVIVSNTGSDGAKFSPSNNIEFISTAGTSTTKTGTVSFAEVGSVTLTGTSATVTATAITPSSAITVKCSTCLSTIPSTKATFKITVASTTDASKALSFSVNRSIGTGGVVGTDIVSITNSGTAGAFMPGQLTFPSTSSSAQKGSVKFSERSDGVILNGTATGPNGSASTAIITPSGPIKVTCSTCPNLVPSTKATFKITTASSVKKLTDLTYTVTRTIGSDGLAGNDIFTPQSTGLSASFTPTPLTFLWSDKTAKTGKVKFATEGTATVTGTSNGTIVPSAAIRVTP